MVSADEPPPAIEDGLKPPLVIPLGIPDALPTLRLTAPLNPLRGVTVVVKVVDWPGMTPFDEGLTAIAKSGLGGSTVMVRVGGVGSELPLPSISVSEATYAPGVLKVTLPGFCAVEVAGDPLGKTHEYLAAAEVVPKETDPPAGIVVSDAGVEIVPFGGNVA
jgi:hypothetical protein